MLKSKINLHKLKRAGGAASADHVTGAKWSSSPPPPSPPSSPPPPPPIHKFKCILLPFFSQCVDYFCLHIFILLLTNSVHLFFRVYNNYLASFLEGINSTIFI